MQTLSVDLVQKWKKLGFKWKYQKDSAWYQFENEKEDTIICIWNDGSCVWCEDKQGFPQSIEEEEYEVVWETIRFLKNIKI